MAAAFDPTSSSIRIQRMLNARRPPVSTSKLTPIASPVFHAARIGRADGGLIDSPAAPVTGPIVTTTGGRTDAHPVHVPNEAYVINAENVAHLGEGNSLAGMKLLTDMFGAPWNAKGGPLGAAMPKMQHGPGPGKPNAPYPAMAIPMPKPGAMFAAGGDARGGHVSGGGGATPIMISGGEFIIRPEEVARRGNGNISKGHKILDAWQNHLMKKHIDTLKKLPGPAR